MNKAACTEADLARGLTENKIDRVQRYALITRIVVFEPLEAYRKGGWRRESQNVGFRRKLIIKGAVACRWGATRQVGKKLKEGTGEFVELWECRGQLGTADEPWWMKKPADPALAASATNVPVLGLKGKGKQPDLESFQPRLWATI